MYYNFLDIENLKSQKEKIGQAIEAQEQERVKVRIYPVSPCYPVCLKIPIFLLQLIDKIQEMNARLKSVTASLEEKKRIWAECDKTLEQAEMGLSKVIRSISTVTTCWFRSIA